MSPIPKKRGRPRIYPKGVKAKVDVVNRRLRRRAQAAAARQNNIRIQIYTAEQVQVEPSIPHQGHFQSLNNLDILADAATSQVITSQLAKIPDPSNETRGPTLYDKELPSSHCAALLSLGSCSTIPEYEPVYAPLNPSQPTSPGSQSVIEAALEDDTNCFDNDDDIFPPSDPSPTHNSTLDGDSNVDQSIEQPTSLVNTNVKDVSDEITGSGEGIPSRPQQDGNASGQEEGDSDFDFVAEDAETDSDSETDLSPGEESAGIEVSLDDTIQTNSSLAKTFLENTWSRLCDCENEENPPESDGERVFNLKQMAEYWQSLGVPNAIGSTALPYEAGEEERNVDWFSILSGGERRPHLCLETSQENTPSIKRTWDVDSIICWASCLSIIRGLHLSYFPLPTRNLGTNRHVSHQGKALNLIPHLRLGSGRHSPEFDVFVFFPGVSHACRTTSYLTNDEHRLWVDRLLLPAIREVCPQDVIQYQPRSFDDAESKTYSRRRENISGKARNNVDMHHYLPPEYLEDIWRHICRSAQQSDLVKFQGLFIVLSAKNIKLQARSPNFQECRTNIIDHLRRVLDWSKADLSNTWIDVGIEDTAASRNSTFLMKSCCLKPWVDSMKYSNQSPLVAAEHFNWNLTGQAGSARVETRKSNPLRKGGIVYAQRYNVNKDIFSTASKRDHGLFGEPSLEGMSCPPSLLDAWIVAARQYRNAGLATTSKSSKQLRRIRKVFEAMKYRIRRALDSALRTSFSAREEYRISWELFLEVDPSAEVPSGSHRPFWILPTSHVNEFMRWEFNRWIFAIEFVRLRGTQHDSTWEDHQRNMIMATILLRSLKASINCHHVAKRSQMFKDSYNNRNGKCLRGLDFETSMRKTGLAWLPRDLFNWPGLHLHDELVTSTSFTFNGLQGVFRNWKDVNTVNQQYGEARDLEYRLQTSDRNNHSHILDLMRKMVYRQFALQVIQQLDADPNFEETEVQQGYRGLSFDVVHNLLGGMPYLVQVRKGKHGLGNTYPERVQGIFNWDDDIPRTFWDQCFYRQLARKFCASISACVSPADAQDWKASLGRQALPYLWIIPNYNKHSLFTKTASRPAITRPFISGLLEWSMCVDERDPFIEGNWLIGRDTYMSTYPAKLSEQSGDHQVASNVESQVISTRVIDFRCAIPFTEIPELIKEGFEAQRELPHVDVKVAAHYQIAHDCLEQSLGDPLCDVLLMIVLTFASSTVTPALPMRSSHFVVGPRKDPGFLAVALTTRMLWFLHREYFPWYVDDDAALGVPEMTKKMGKCMPPISARHPN
ncbi:hypothetical protein V497_01104 [Pseudogymnoascus sp. VKM F-4516 (FW-969)]|nr:hypothetical protein V497_01104 [Pseudogymnoascus sp. VKM F-4516 (FW-969)]